jgi:hypothetical protein
VIPRVVNTRRTCRGPTSVSGGGLAARHLAPAGLAAQAESHGRGSKPDSVIGPVCPAEERSGTLRGMSGRMRQHAAARGAPLCRPMTRQDPPQRLLGGPRNDEPSILLASDETHARRLHHLCARSTDNRSHADGNRQARKLARTVGNYCVETELVGVHTRAPRRVVRQYHGEGTEHGTRDKANRRKQSGARTGRVVH